MNKERTFYVLDSVSNQGAVIETPAKGAPSNWRFFKGKSLAAEFPTGAVLKFSKDFPKQYKLFDFVSNTLSLLIASQKVKDILDSLGIDNCEYLSVSIKNHKDKIVGPNYYIIHPLNGEEGIDMEKSVYDRDAFDENEIHRVRKLSLNKEQISPSVHLFRFKPLPHDYFVDSILAIALKKSKVTGFRLLEADNWNGSYRNMEDYFYGPL
jgi:hypothetical protein